MSHWTATIVSWVLLSSITLNADFIRRPAQESPAAKRIEDNLHSSYKQYKEKYLSGSWASRLRAIEAESYTVQEGDSLWAISRVLFGEGFYWPQVWASNPQYKNPHNISSGDEIRFSMGNESNIPEIFIVKGELVDVEIPEAKPSLPVLTELPLSLPEEEGDEDGSYDSLRFKLRERKKNSYNARITMDSYFTEAVPQTLGRVEEMPENRFAATKLDSVYVRMNGFARSGNRYQIIGKKPREIDTDLDEGGSLRGYVVKHLGNIRLREKVNNEKNIFKADVIDAIGQIPSFSTVVPFQRLEVDLSKRGRDVRARAQIVGGRYREDRRVMGNGETVYLNVGLQSGVRPGDRLTVIANDKLRKEETNVELGHRQIGRIQIIKSEERISTGIIINSTREIREGDVTL